MQGLLLGLLLVLSIVGLLVWMRRDTADSTAKSSARAGDNTAFHAVAIKYSDKACDAAKAMTGRRFLSNAAPRLPLPECDLLECRCRFVHYKDRRTDRDRRSPFATSSASGTTGTSEQNRRENADRRSDANLDD